MKVLVTGATGFIGNYVVKELLKHNHSVIASSAKAAKAQQAEWFSNVNYVLFNFTDFDVAVNYFDFFDRPDLMIHLAWEGLPNYKSAFHEEINLPRHLAFLTNLIENGLHDVTVTGTCFEYGMQEGSLIESMPTFPSNPYGRAKDSLKKKMQLLEQKNHFVFKWVRLFYMYGKGQNPNSLLSQLDTALKNGDTVFNMSGGEQLRDFLPVEKIAEKIVKIALQEKITGVINCCSGEPISIKTFVENYLAKRHKKITLNLGFYPYLDYEPMHFWGDVSKFKKITDNE